MEVSEFNHEIAILGLGIIDRWEIQKLIWLGVTDGEVQSLIMILLLMGGSESDIGVRCY